jgi:hypothetical protein
MAIMEIPIALYMYESDFIEFVVIGKCTSDRPAIAPRAAAGRMATQGAIW